MHIPITLMGHSVLGLCYFPTPITPIANGKIDTLLGCRIIIQLKFSVLYYITMTTFYNVPDASLSLHHIQSLSTPLYPPPFPPPCAALFHCVVCFEIIRGSNPGVVFRDQDLSCVCTLPVLVFHDPSANVHMSIV